LKVHICYIDPSGDRIIERLCRYLADGAGWTFSDRPQEGVDLNLSGLYIDYAQRFTDWRKTPWAAYFSHFEPDTPYKKFWWETAAPLIDIKTVTAERYGKILPGKVVKVIPPVEPQFEIRERKANKTPLIGVSGFVDRHTGRKGERLVARLAGDLEERAEIIATGEGWPVRTVNRGMAGLVDFYNSLDLYLCASLIEGIPMPPLEALACGVPVVIPRGVGMLDELPDVPGIYRFDKGDYESLKVTVQAALIGKPDRQQLRNAVAKYTPEAWVKSHIKGFTSALGKKASKPTRIKNRQSAQHESDRHGQRGVYFVAYGKPARDCALGAIDSFKRYLPDIPVALASDKPLGPEDIFIQHPDEDIGGRAAKVAIYDLAPADWQYVCYLDADVEIVSANDTLWRIVESGWDMVICKNPGRFHIAREMRRSDNGDECETTFGRIGTDEVIQLNGGVFCFQRNDRTRAFFDAWNTEWRRWGKRDQAALLRALWANPLKLWVLTNHWNLITRYDNPDNAAWLRHYPMTARRWRGIIDHPLSSPEAWAKVHEFEKAAK
jgi:hypothetical protein